MSAAAKPPSGAALVFRILLSGLFLLGGAGLVREGVRAIRNQAYILSYTEGLHWASGTAPGSAGGEPQAAGFCGRDAVVFGTGFAALGGMFLLWSAGLGLGLLENGGRGRVPPAVFKGIAAASLTTLVLASLALFPVWHGRMLPFYFVLAAFTLALTLPVPAQVRKKVFPAVVMAVIASGFVGLPAFPVFAGLLVFLIAGTHVLILRPGLFPASLRPPRTPGRS